MDNIDKNNHNEDANLDKLNYPATDDIYQKAQKENFIEEDEASSMDGELDVPGAELDDANESIGEEDEENNYYSLGGDNHQDLDESN
ncbi:MAG TPA: hypothetical protein PK504_03510 [Ferruginibacter sp.]|nr:hypothetical protein [Ferruginibacter sp.]HRE64808.1 hypothetical protein [Ferruginibacter sp.]